MSYRSEYSGPKGNQRLTGCITKTRHADGCTTVQRRNAQSGFFGGHVHGKVTSRRTYGPSR
jgi:hypothetical protein